MAALSDIRKGLRIEIEGEPYRVIEFQHVKPARGHAFIRSRLKHLETGNIKDHTFDSGEPIVQADVEERETQYLYRSSEGFHFMDQETYEEALLSMKQVGEDVVGYLVEGTEVTIVYYRNRPLQIVLPNFIALKVVEAAPGVKGDTAVGGMKPARLETGLTIKVPLFVVEGDVIRVDSRNSEYIERVRGNES